MSSNRKGDRRERELVNRLDGAGFAVMRAPASGSATDRELPDVLAGDSETFYAIEAKSSAGRPIYLSGEEVEALIYFARNFGAKARVAVRFDREAWYFFHPGDLHTTDGGNYRVKKETALAEGEDFESFVGGPAQARLTDVGDDSEVGDGEVGDSGVGDSEVGDSGVGDEGDGDDSDGDGSDGTTPSGDGGTGGDTDHRS